MARTVNPWLADAADGATGETFEIRTIADFLRVPESRRCICLREFHALMAVREGVTAILCAAGDGNTIQPESLHWHDDVYRWVDDGKATIAVEMLAGDAPPGTEAGR